MLLLENVCSSIGLIVHELLRQCTQSKGVSHRGRYLMLHGGLVLDGVECHRDAVCVVVGRSERGEAGGWMVQGRVK